MFQVKGLYKGYGGEFGLQDINMNVETGTIHGLIGENGSGKTTLIKCLTGIFEPEQGEILYDGQSVYDNPSVKERMGYVADSNQYFSSYKIWKLAKFFEGVYPNFKMEDFEALNKIFKIDLGKKMRQLSKGQQMRVGFMLNIASNPDLLILDEPTSGLDAIAKKKLLDILVANVENREMTVIISSHHLTDLEKICDEVTVIHRGKVQVSDGVVEAKENIVKMQIVFPKGAPQEFFHTEGMLDYSNIGNVYTAMLHSDDNWEATFTDMGATYVETLPVDLEEMFIYMNQEVEDSEN